MWWAPSSTARRATSTAVAGSTRGPSHRPGSCIAPKPSRGIVMLPPSSKVFEAAESIGEGLMTRSMVTRTTDHTRARAHPPGRRLALERAPARSVGPTTADRRGNHVLYTLFGRTGLRVSELSLGAMTFGGEPGRGADKDTSE